MGLGNPLLSIPTLAIRFEAASCPKIPGVCEVGYTANGVAVWFLTRFREDPIEGTRLLFATAPFLHPHACAQRRDGREARQD
jgi:hypothetical protein